MKLAHESVVKVLYFSIISTDFIFILPCIQNYEKYSESQFIYLCFLNVQIGSCGWVEKKNNVDSNPNKDSVLHSKDQAQQERSDGGDQVFLCTTYLGISFRSTQ